MPKLKKGSAAARAYMAEIRGKKNVSGLLGVKKAGHHTSVHYSRIKAHSKGRKVGALPIGFTGKFYGVPFKIYNQYTLDGGVVAIAENTKTGALICSIDGENTEKSINSFYTHIVTNHEQGDGYYVEKKALPIIKKDVAKFVKQLAGEVLAYNAGNKQTEAPKKINIKKPIAAKAYVAKIRSKKVEKATIASKAKTLRNALKREGLKMPHGYKVEKRLIINGPFEIAATVTKLKAIKDGIKLHENLRKSAPVSLKRRYTSEIAAMKKSFSALKKFLTSQTNSIK